ncbi:MAG: hypothetical protein HY820_42000 [Acidobacteria bacterium]|nr:hypothetical protein [Acidobacteriota bacterium]
MKKELDCRDAMDAMTGLSPNTGTLPSGLQRHLSKCASCRDEWEAQSEVMAVLTPHQSVAASDSFQERVMKAIIQERISENRIAPPQARRWLRWVPAAIAAAALLLAIPFFTATRQPSPGASLLAQSASAFSKVQSVHIQGRIRTVPGDNFELIGAEYDFVPIELWRQYGETARWRVQKPGRVAVMDGKSATLYIEHTNTAAAGGPSAGFVDWLKPLLDPQGILQREIRAANSGEAQIQINQTAAVKAVSMKRHAKGDFTNAWTFNKSIQEADHTCTYRFDPASGLLAGLAVSIQTAAGEVTVAEFDRFLYNEPMPDSLFALQIPENAIWSKNDGGPAREASITFSGPKEAAAYFFDALGRKDWDAALVVYPHTAASEVLKRAYGGVEVIRLGEPFQSGLYRGWFVPYELRMPNGRIKKWNIAVRNDNPQHRWVMDGGF